MALRAPDVLCQTRTPAARRAAATAFCRATSQANTRRGERVPGGPHGVDHLEDAIAGRSGTHVVDDRAQLTPALSTGQGASCREPRRVNIASGCGYPGTGTPSS